MSTFDDWWDDWMGMNAPKNERYEIAKDAWDAALKLAQTEDLDIAYMKGYSDGKQAVQESSDENK